MWNQSWTSVRALHPSASLEAEGGKRRAHENQRTGTRMNARARQPKQGARKENKVRVTGNNEF